MYKKLSQVQLKNVRDEEKVEFLQIQSKLGFKQEADFYAFCAAISVYKVNRNSNFKIYSLKYAKNAWHATSIQGIDLFENIIDLYNDDAYKSPKEIFEGFFYTGFLIVREWWNKKGQDCKDELERFVDLFRFLEGK